MKVARWALVAFLLGCSAGGAPADLSTIEGFCPALMRASLAFGKRCLDNRAGYDLEGYVAWGPCASIIASAKAGHLLYDPTHAAECLAAVENRACSVAYEPIHACEGVTRTQVPAGGACATTVYPGSAECREGTFCPLSSNPCTSICTEIKARGAACDPARDQCAAGTACSGGICVDEGQETQPCGVPGTSPRCTLGTTCIGASPDAGTPGTCLPPTLDGPCSGTLDGACIPGRAWCPGPGPSRCVPFKEPGESCTRDIDCGGVCTAAGTCKAVLQPVGQPCGGKVGCALGAYCHPTTSICTRTTPPGGPCTVDVECGLLPSQARCDPASHTCVFVCPQAAPP